MEQNQNENREKLIACAKQEFLEKGFAKASLRKISGDAGLTTGAVYFFFHDKEGLFGAIVDEPLSRIMQVLQTHFAEDAEEDLRSYQHQNGDHDAFAEQLITAMYADYDALIILLHHAGGSRYEGITERMIDMLDAYYEQLAARYAALFTGKRVNRYMLHWFSHVQINAFVHLLEHEPDSEKALEKIKPVMDCLIEGWVKYILEDDRPAG